MSVTTIRPYLNFWREYPEEAEWAIQMIKFWLKEPKTMTQLHPTEPDVPPDDLHRKFNRNISVIYGRFRDIHPEYTRWVDKVFNSKCPGFCFVHPDSEIQFPPLAHKNMLILSVMKACEDWIDENRHYLEWGRQEMRIWIEYEIETPTPPKYEALMRALDCVDTPIPAVVNTPVLAVVNTPIPAVVHTPVPPPVNTPIPAVVHTPVPPPVNTPIPAVVHTPVPPPVNTPIPAVVHTPVPPPVNTSIFLALCHLLFCIGHQTNECLVLLARNQYVRMALVIFVIMTVLDFGAFFHYMDVKASGFVSEVPVMFTMRKTISGVNWMFSKARHRVVYEFMQTQLYEDLIVIMNIFQADITWLEKIKVYCSLSEWC
jgi:hypothetical protein